MCAKLPDIREYFHCDSDDLETVLKKTMIRVPEATIKQVLVDLCRHSTCKKCKRNTHRLRWTMRIQQCFADSEALRKEFNKSYNYAPPISVDSWAKIFAAIRKNEKGSEEYKNAQKALAWNRNLHFSNYFK